MSDKNTGGPAFPHSVQRWNDSFGNVDGMLLRDYFAAKAMQAFVSSYQEGAITNPMDDIAEDSYEMADAMLRARSA